MAEIPAGEALKELTGTLEELRQFYAFDTDRMWSNSVQFFKEDGADHVLLVFRETITAQEVAENGAEGETKNLVGKNVGSVIMPIKVAKSLGQILTRHLSEPDGD